ncbi:tungsten-dependent formylmethanofuran dehydrogenase subunit FwdC [Methanocaldococcus indicus]|uniref:tungsten-dependent formylmethanofuran dehydrogenase subunit FwdC n=1 Tax=Methanocaldococcus indicus TaxID=213231 RepID=UPI003C6D0BA7
MKEIILTFKDIALKTSVDMSVVLPEKLAEMKEDEIKNINLQYGRKKIKLCDIFDISINDIDGEPKIIIENSNDYLYHIGEEMTKGEIIVNGNAGMYVGARMKGGRIVVNGNVDNWVGQDMFGGEIVVKGDARDYVGSSYRGDWRGMEGGTIIIEGNARHEVGEFMLNGLIHIKGNSGIFTGIHLNGGKIIVDGDVDVRTGGEMRKGAIVVKGKIREVLPSFKFVEIVENPIIKVGKKDPGLKVEGTYYKFIGDYAESAKPKGELYISVDKNPDLI